MKKIFILIFAITLFLVPRDLIAGEDNDEGGEVVKASEDDVNHVIREQVLAELDAKHAVEQEAWLQAELHRKMGMASNLYKREVRTAEEGWLSRQQEATRDLMIGLGESAFDKDLVGAFIKTAEYAVDALINDIQTNREIDDIGKRNNIAVGQAIEDYQHSSDATSVTPSGTFGGIDVFFIQPSPVGNILRTDLIQEKRLNGGLVAKITYPEDNPLVRGDIPICGVAYGRRFKEYRLEYGEGENPDEWHTIIASDKPQRRDISPKDLSGLVKSPFDSMALWDTGFKNFPTWDYRPDHPVDLNGVYTLRLRVIGADGGIAEDTKRFEVGRVITMSFGGTAVSADNKVSLNLPEHALINTVFRIITIKPIIDFSLRIPPGYVSRQKIYEFQPAGELFAKNALLKMSYGDSGAPDIDEARLGIYTYNNVSEAWEYVPGKVDKHNKCVSARIRGLLPGRAYFTLFQKKSGQELLRPYLLSGREENRVLASPFDASEYRTVEFDYKINKDAKVNLFFKVAGKWYEVGFTDDINRYAYKYTNIANIGKIEGVSADGEWHTAKFDLYKMLKTKTRNTLVEEIIMADFDIGGNLELAYGTNSKGTAYYMDKFEISRNRDTAALLKDSAELTGRPYVFYSPDGADCRYSFVDNEPDRRDRLVINYKIPHRGSYAGYLVFLDNKDLSEFQELSFRVKGGAGGERFGLQFNGGCGGESSEIDTARYLSREIDCSWQDISIPLSVFKGIDNWENVRSFSIQFRSDNGHNSGSIYIDEIRLKRRLTAIKVEDFESWGQKNLLGGDTFTFGSSVCKIEADYGRDYGYGGSAGGCRIDYGGRIGVSHVRCTSFAAWTTELEGLDATDIAGLSFFIKGAAGGERPNIYLKDSITGNICVDIEKYAPVTTAWQKVEIPLKDFKELGLDLSYLTELSFIFQGKIEPGAIFIDEIAFK